MLCVKYSQITNLAQGLIAFFIFVYFLSLIFLLNYINRLGHSKKSEIRNQKQFYLTQYI